MYIPNGTEHTFRVQHVNASPVVQVSISSSSLVLRLLSVFLVGTSPALVVINLAYHDERILYVTLN
jgi:hypothetical protein